MNRVRNAVLISVFSSLSYIFMLFEIVIFPVFAWLKYDLSDVPLLLLGFKLGPSAAFVSLLIRTILFYITKGDGWGVIGMSFSFISGFIFVFIPSFIYSRRKSMRSAVFSLITGTILMALIMAPLNYIVASRVMNMSGNDLYRYIFYGVFPFNLIKGIINTIITIVLYKRLWRVLKRI
ncbi:MAG: ECF transporter S component [Candidatus Muiribacteriaceae bacterium]